MSPLGLLRGVHVLAGASWLGEVVVINFVLVPVAARLDGAARLRFLGAVFPRVFRVASVMTATVAVTGLLQLWWRYWGRFGVLASSRHGVALLAGAFLAGVLITFHFLAEPRLEGLIAEAEANPDAGVDDGIIALLQLIPRIGLAVLVVSLLAMVYAIHGL